MSAYANSPHRREYFRRKDAGLCVRDGCPKAAHPKYVLCEAHKAAEVARIAEHRASRPAMPKLRGAPEISARQQWAVDEAIRAGSVRKGAAATGTDYRAFFSLIRCAEDKAGKRLAPRDRDTKQAGLDDEEDQTEAEILQQVSLGFRCRRCHQVLPHQCLGGLEAFMYSGTTMLAEAEEDAPRPNKPRPSRVGERRRKRERAAA